MVLLQENPLWFHRPIPEKRILDAASKLFAERGYGATSTKAIARRAGVNEVTLFRRFTNKAGILEGLARRMAERSAGEAASRRAAQPEGPAGVRATLRSLAQVEIENAQRDGGLALRLMIESRTVPEIAALMGDRPRRNLEGLTRYIASRQAAGELRAGVDPRLAAEAFFSLTSSLVMFRMMTGPELPPAGIVSDRDIDQLFDLFWSGISQEETT